MHGVTWPESKCIDRAGIVFGIAGLGRNYRIPLLPSPWAYSTCRGS
ncbi:hydroxyisourate hydrolase [Herminiimonas sp. CN]|nr:hydroxyisourate hydrolase [Herminiimonas sp. CN]